MFGDGVTHILCGDLVVKIFLDRYCFPSVPEEQAMCTPKGFPMKDVGIIDRFHVISLVHRVIVKQQIIKKKSKYQKDIFIDLNELSLSFEFTWLFNFSSFIRSDAAKFKQDLLNIAKTTISSKILTQYKDMFAELAVNAVLRLKGSGNLDAIQIIKKLGGGLQDSYLDEGKNDNFFFFKKKKKRKEKKEKT